MQYILYANNLIHVGLIEQTVLLIILFLGHLHSGDTKFGPIIFVFITSIKGTSDLYSEERDIFSGSRNLGLFILHYFRGHLSTQKVTDLKEGWHL